MTVRKSRSTRSSPLVSPLMLDGTYLSRNFATLGPLPDSRYINKYNIEIKKEEKIGAQGLTVRPLVYFLFYYQ